MLACNLILPRTDEFSNVHLLLLLNGCQLASQASSCKKQCHLCRGASGAPGHIFSNCANEGSTQQPKWLYLSMKFNSFNFSHNKICLHVKLFVYGEWCGILCKLLIMFCKAILLKYFLYFLPLR